MLTAAAWVVAVAQVESLPENFYMRWIWPKKSMLGHGCDPQLSSVG